MIYDFQVSLSRFTLKSRLTTIKLQNYVNNNSSLAKKAKILGNKYIPLVVVLVTLFYT